MTRPKNFESEIQRLESMIKERETSTLRATKTLFEDVGAYHAGHTEDFPYPSLFGLINAYLRPRLVLVFGGLLGVFFTFTQVYFLYVQNKLIEAQNKIVESQTVSAKQQTVSMIVSRLDSNNKESTAIALSELTELGNEGVSVVVNIARTESEVKYVALDFLGTEFPNYDHDTQLEILKISVDDLISNLHKNYLYKISLKVKNDYDYNAAQLDVKTSSKLIEMNLLNFGNTESLDFKPSNLVSISSYIREKFYSGISSTEGWSKVFDCNIRGGACNIENEIKNIELLINDFCQNTNYWSETTPLGDRYVQHDYNSEPTLGSAMAANQITNYYMFTKDKYCSPRSVMGSFE